MTTFWLQTKAPAGNWVDNTGCDDIAMLKRHGRYLCNVRGERVRIVKREDRAVWHPIKKDEGDTP